MTVTTQSSKIIYQGNGATTVFSFMFEIPESTDAFVYYTDADGVQTLLNPALYTVTGLGEPAGGSVTYPLSGSPIAAGTKLTIQRVVPLTQEVDLVNQDGFYPEVVEGGLDTLEFQIQQLEEQFARAIVLNVSDTSTDTQLPPQVVRAGKILGFDSDGNPTAVSTLPTNIVSAAMIPVVEAATLQLAADKFGVIKELAVSQFGAVGNGTTDDTAAFVAALAALGGTGGQLRVQAGKYKITEKLIITLNSLCKSISLIGDGQGSTILYWPTATGGIEVDYADGLNSFHIENISLTCGIADAGSALLLHQATPLGMLSQSEVFNIIMRGDDCTASGPGAFNWTVGVDIVGVSAVNVDGLSVFGRGNATGCTGINLSGNLSVSPNFGIIYNITNCLFLWTNTGINHGQKIQGVVIDRCQFTNGITGISTTSLASGGTLLNITNSQFNTSGNQIFFQTIMGDVFISGNLIYVPPSVAGVGRAGIVLNGSLGCTIVNNHITTLAGPDLNQGIIDTGSGNMITCNIIVNLATGIWMKPGAALGFATITANNIQSNTTGVLVESAAVMITGNMINDNTLGTHYTATSSLCNQQSNVLVNNATATTDAGAGNTIGGGSP